MQAIFRRTFRPPTEWQDFVEAGYAVLTKVVASGCLHTIRHAIDMVWLTPRSTPSAVSMYICKSHCRVMQQPLPSTKPVRHSMRLLQQLS